MKMIAQYNRSINHYEVYCSSNAKSNGDYHYVGAVPGGSGSGSGLMVRASA